MNERNGGLFEKQNYFTLRFGHHVVSPDTSRLHNFLFFEDLFRFRRAASISSNQLQT